MQSIFKQTGTYSCAGTQEYARERMQHGFVERLYKSVPRDTAWHHSAERRDAKQLPSGQNCLSYLQTHDRFLYFLVRVSIFFVKISLIT